jgi:hypothetical protein
MGPHDSGWAPVVAAGLFGVILGALGAHLPIETFCGSSGPSLGAESPAICAREWLGIGASAIGGALTLAAAYVAVRPVWRQVRLQTTQTEIQTLQILRERLVDMKEEIDSICSLEEAGGIILSLEVSNFIDVANHQLNPDPSEVIRHAEEAIGQGADALSRRAEETEAASPVWERRIMLGEGGNAVLHSLDTIRGGIAQIKNIEEFFMDETRLRDAQVTLADELQRAQQQWRELAQLAERSRCALTEERRRTALRIERLRQTI